MDREEECGENGDLLRKRAAKQEVRDYEYAASGRDARDLHADLHAERPYQRIGENPEERQVLRMRFTEEHIVTCGPETLPRERVDNRVTHDGELKSRERERDEEPAQEGEQEQRTPGGNFPSHGPHHTEKAEAGANLSRVKTHIQRNQSFQQIFFPSDTVRGW